MNLGKIGEKSAYSFKKLIKIKSKEYAMDYLLELKSRHTKMENLHYIELKLQDYLNTSEISVQEAKKLYRYRTRLANRVHKTHEPSSDPNFENPKLPHSSGTRRPFRNQLFTLSTIYTLQIFN